MRSITTLFLLGPSILFAQNTFQRLVLADYAYGRAVATTPGGDVLVAGDELDFVTGQYSAPVIKYTAAGAFLWNAHVFLPAIGGFSNTTVDALAATSGGGALITGQFDTDFDPDSIYVAELDATGALLWSKRFEPAVVAVVEVRTTNVIEAPNGDVLVCGEIATDAGQLQDDAYLSRFDTDGTHLWTKHIVAPVASTFNRTGAIILPSTGGILLAGQTTLFSEGSWLMMLDDGGTLQWVKKYALGGGVLDEPPVGLSETSTGYVVYYSTVFGADSIPLFRIATDLSGNATGAWSYQVQSGALSLVNDVAALSGGGHLVTGNNVYTLPTYNIQAFMMKLDVAGTVLWANEYGTNGAETGEGGDATSDGGFLMAGSGQEDSLAFSGGDERGGVPVDMYLVKADGNGNSGGCETPMPVMVNTETFSSSPYTQNLTSIIGWSTMAFSTGGNYAESSACIDQGVLDLSSAGPLDAYPNPTSGVITIELPVGGEWRHALIDATGRILIQFTKQGEERSDLDLRDMPSGRYVLRSTNATSLHHTPVMVIH